MKKRYFKKWVENTLTTITLILFTLVCMTSDIKSGYEYILFIILAILILNIILLKKYGREFNKLILESEEE